MSDCGGWQHGGSIKCLDSEARMFSSNPGSVV